MIRVILCDDHALIRRGIRDTLSDAPDIEVVGEAGDYGELRSLLRTTSCDVLVLDINLPDATGWDVLRRLRAAGCDVPVVVLSAVPPNPTRVREFQPLGVLYKPLPIDALLRLIRVACGASAPQEILQ